MTVPLRGAKTSVGLGIKGRSREPDRYREPDAPPLLCAADLGIAPLQSKQGAVDSAYSAAITEFVLASRDRQDAMHLALVGPPLAGRRLLLVQADRSERRNYYLIHQTNHRVAWRDYYYAAIYVLVTKADLAWRSEELEMTHPTVSGWPRGLLKAMLDGLGHACDEHELALRRVYLTANPVAFQSAIDRLEELRMAGEQRPHRDVDVVEISSEQLGIGKHDGLRIFRVRLPRAR